MALVRAGVVVKVGDGPQVVVQGFFDERIAAQAVADAIGQALAKAMPVSARAPEVPRKRRGCSVQLGITANIARTQAELARLRLEAAASAGAPPERLRLLEAESIRKSLEADIREAAAKSCREAAWESSDASA